MCMIYGTDRTISARPSLSPRLMISGKKSELTFHRYCRQAGQASQEWLQGDTFAGGVHALPQRDGAKTNGIKRWPIKIQPPLLSLAPSSERRNPGEGTHSLCPAPCLSRLLHEQISQDLSLSFSLRRLWLVLYSGLRSVYHRTGLAAGCSTFSKVSLLCARMRRVKGER